MGDELRDRYGRWALVTGASDGIGRAFARRLAAEGLCLVVVARRRSLLEDLATALRAEHGVEVDVVSADLATAEGRAATIIAAATREVGPLVLGAGFGTAGPLLTTDLDDEREMLVVNCLAPLEQIHRLVPAMRERGRGGVVLLSSLLGYQGVPRAAHYAATKAYVQSLAEGLRHELAPHGIDVLAVAPGPVDSGFGARADMRLGATVRPDTVAAGALRALGRRGTATPGALSKGLTWSLRTAPRALRVRLVGRVMAGMTAHHDG